MKIRFLIANANAVGGTVKTTFNTAGELAKHHDVEVVSVYRMREEPAFPVPPGVRVRYLSDQIAGVERTGGLRGKVHDWASRQPSRVIHPKDFRYHRFNLVSDVALMRYIRSVRDGVLVGTRAGLNLAIARYGRRSVVRIGQEHLHLTKYNAELRASMRDFYPELDAYVALTEGDARAFRGVLGPGARVVCIPNSVPDVHGVRAELDAKVIIAAGRLSQQKGFDRLLDAWRLVAKEHPGWELRIFGGGDLHDELVTMIATLGIGDSVTMPGFTHNLPHEMGRASAYVMSSRFEGFPMVLLEAMGCGLPVVSFDCPNGPRDLITEGVDGFIVPNGDVEALAEAMGRIIDIGEGRKALGAAAVQKAQQYDSAHIGTRWTQLMLELQASKRRRP